VLRRKDAYVDRETTDSFVDIFLQKFLRQQYKKENKEYPDLCLLPELTEQTLMDNLKDRFDSGYIYTYIGEA